LEGVDVYAIQDATKFLFYFTRLKCNWQGGGFPAPVVAKGGADGPGEER